MSNELVLIVSLVCIYAAVVLFYKFFGKTGLYMWTPLSQLILKR